jgi:predicted metal-dependent phosphoesterase TrpH
MKTAQELRAIAEAKNKSTEIKNALIPAMEKSASNGKFTITFITNGDKMIDSDVEIMTEAGYSIEYSESENGYVISW